jgi:hypothetical protein
VLGALVAGAWGVWLGGAGCAGVDDVSIQVACGDFATFADVSSVLEARCGTLDCHGSIARPLRIYGRRGLRKPVDFEADDAESQVLQAEIAAGQGQAEYFPGGLQVTTNGELVDNYHSVCGLEPELMDKVRKGQESPDVLTLTRKARLVEKHKGGKIFVPAQSPGDTCITSWLTAPADNPAALERADCLEELEGF